MADESKERLNEVPKVEREAFADSEAAKAADHVVPEPPEGAGEAPEPAPAQDVAVKLNPDLTLDGKEAHVAVAGFEDITLYANKTVKVPADHALALEGAGVGVTE